MNENRNVELSRMVRSLSPGGVVAIEDVPLRDLPLVPYEKIAGGPQYLFSDHPEYIGVAEGAVLRETVEPGIVRLYTYHCNGVEGSVRKITWTMENLGKRPLRYRFLRSAFAGPDAEYGAVAKRALKAFFDSTPEQVTEEIPLGGAVVLDSRADAARVEFNELVHGFYEIEVDQPARITVFQTDPDTDSVAAAKRLDMSNVLPPHTPSGAGRGIYHTSNYRVVSGPDFVLDTGNGPMQMIVADGKIDPWIRGYDSSTQRETLLEGNYGVLYEIRIAYKTSDRRGWAVLTWNARSRDRWCEQMINVVRVNAGLHPEGFVEIPGDRVSLTGELDCSLLQIYPPLPERDGEGLIELTYTPPGASCLPTPILFIPIDME